MSRKFKDVLSFSVFSFSRMFNCDKKILDKISYDLLIVWLSFLSLLKKNSSLKLFLCSAFVFRVSSMVQLSEIRATK